MRDKIKVGDFRQGCLRSIAPSAWVLVQGPTLQYISRVVPPIAQHNQGCAASSQKIGNSRISAAITLSVSLSLSRSLLLMLMLLLLLRLLLLLLLRLLLLLVAQGMTWRELPRALWATHHSLRERGGTVELCTHMVYTRL